MSRSVISSFEILPTTLDRILDRERRKRLAVRSKDRQRGVDAVGANDAKVDRCALGSDRTEFRAFGQKSLLRKRDEMCACGLAIQGCDRDKIDRRHEGSRLR